MIDKMIAKVGEKAAVAISAALSAAIVGLIAAIQIHFATRKAYNNGRKDEREIWIEQEKIWQKKVKDIKESNRSLWDKLKEVKKLRKEFEEYKERKS